MPHSHKHHVPRKLQKDLCAPAQAGLRAALTGHMYDGYNPRDMAHGNIPPFIG